jgi:putative membrane protein
MPARKIVARLGVAACLLLPFAACSNPPPPVTTTAPPRPTSHLSTADRDFLDQAMRAGLAEVQFGHLAVQQGTRPQVRQFGQEMVDRYTAVDRQLADLAQRNGITPSSGAGPAGQDAIARLRALRGAAFDRAYLQGQIAALKDALALYQQQATQGTDPDVTAFATQTAPVIRDHLQVASALQGGQLLPAIR